MALFYRSISPLFLTIHQKLNWSPQDDLYFSDHFPINIQISAATKNTPHEKFRKRQIGKAHWALFNEHIQTDDITNLLNMDIKVQKFTEATISEAQKNTTKSSSRPSKKEVP